MRTHFLAVLTVLTMGAFPALAADPAAPAPAQTPVSAKHSKELVTTAIGKKTHPESILMATYKLARKEPAYEKWAELSPTVQKAADIDKPTVARSEMMRMKVGYDTLDLGQPLVIQTRLSLDRYSTLSQEMILSEFNPRTYFKYKMYGENVAIIAEDIIEYSRLYIDKMQIEKFLKEAGGSRSLLGEILVRPRFGSLHQTVVDREISYYVLIGEIAEFRIWGNGSNGPVLLWFDRADWYKPTDRNNLMDLKSPM